MSLNLSVYIMSLFLSVYIMSLNLSVYIMSLNLSVYSFSLYLCMSTVKRGKSAKLQSPKEKPHLKTVLFARAF